MLHICSYNNLVRLCSIMSVYLFIYLLTQLWQKSSFFFKLLQIHKLKYQVLTFTVIFPKERQTAGRKFAVVGERK
jgi:hypothetical protein